VNKGETPSWIPEYLRRKHEDALKEAYYQKVWYQNDHDLGWWVETREDALKEAYYQKVWYQEDKVAFNIMLQLALSIDESKEDIYVDRNFKR
jgi:hypothetical protein